VEEDTSCFYWDDTRELAALKYGGGQAAAASNREETGTTSACGLQA
jgi:hypothetical protein